jgi:hypothetical protein
MAEDEDHATPGRRRRRTGWTCSSKQLCDARHHKADEADPNDHGAKYDPEATA